MGQKTLGLNGEAYALVVLDIGSDLGAVINTRTREDPWQHLDGLAAIWGHTPKAIGALAQLNLNILTVSKRGVASTMSRLTPSNRIM
jgi:hypothetical protein